MSLITDIALLDIALLDIALLTGIGAVSAIMLVLARRKFAPATTPLVIAINAQLPQTQCAQCGYPGCKPYAEAIADGEAINRCPPGGDATIASLAKLLGREALPLDADCGEHTPTLLAVIREEECIGCTLCIAACPVDAIVGAHQLMHTVVESVCTGCDLCREPCPVDCIDMVPVSCEEATLDFPEHSTPCINCGHCSEVCPRDLQPQLLHWFREDGQRTDSLRLDDCIVCGQCDNVCPSEIPLTQSFRVAKRRKATEAQQKAHAADAERRFQRREARLSESRVRIAKRPGRSDRQQLLAALKEQP